MKSWNVEIGKRVELQSVPSEMQTQKDKNHIVSPMKRVVTEYQCCKGERGETRKERSVWGGV